MQWPRESFICAEYTDAEFALRGICASTIEK